MCAPIASRAASIARSSGSWSDGGEYAPAFAVAAAASAHVAPPPTRHTTVAALRCRCLLLRHRDAAGGPRPPSRAELRRLDDRVVAARDVEVAQLQRADSTLGHRGDD